MKAKKSLRCDGITTMAELEMKYGRGKVSAADWSTIQKHPMTKSKVHKYSRMRLAELRDAGFKYVGVLSSGGPEDCEACKAMKDEKIEIEFAQPLPLPGCDKKYCMCIYLALP